MLRRRFIRTITLVLLLVSLILWMLGFPIHEVGQLLLQGTQRTVTRWAVSYVLTHEEWFAADADRAILTQRLVVRLCLYSPPEEVRVIKEYLTIRPPRHLRGLPVLFEVERHRLRQRTEAPAGPTPPWSQPLRWPAN